jgi:hypothetical protein
MWLVKGHVRIFLADCPTIMSEMMKDRNPEKMAKVTEAFLKMKKFDIAELVRAYER